MDSKVSTNSRNIPAAEFIENVQAYVQSKKNRSYDQLAQELQQTYSKYKFMDSRVTGQKQALLTKIPDIKKALEALNFLIQQKDEENVQTRFELADTVFVKAELSGPKTVFLWLGAKVMLEYGYEEAVALLEKNLKSAETNLSIVEGDLEFLKDQLTVTEVNMARLHNYNVKAKAKV